MKFKHLLFYILFSLIVVSCAKNQGDNFTTDDAALISNSAGGGATATAPVTISVGADAPPANGDNSNLLFGNPTNAVQDAVNYKDNYLINQGYYVEAYSSTKLEPIWVSWHLDNTNTTSAVGRQDSFAAFAGLPSTFTAVQSNSYVFATYGFERGHNCPSADRSSSLNANNSTFLMTNMVPQAPVNNEQTWGNLEDYLRSLTVGGAYEIYIIMGSYGSGGTSAIGTYSKIGPLGVNVPSNIWKVAVILPTGNNDIARVTTATRVLSVNTPNINSINTNWKLYITTMASIEAQGGVHLLSVLPTALHDALAAKLDPGM